MHGPLVQMFEPSPCTTELLSASKGQGQDEEHGKGDLLPTQGTMEGTGAFQGLYVKGSEDNSEGSRQGS